MRHKVKKIKFKKGKDATKMMTVKLVRNFLKKGEIITTLKRAKIAKSYIEKLVEKVKIKTEANKNFLLRFIGNKRLINDLFDRIGLALKDVKGGYVRIVKIGKRESDGSESARLEWAYPINKDNNQ